MKDNLNTSEILGEVFARHWEDCFISSAVDGICYSYRDFFEIACCLGKELNRQKCAQGDFVGLLLPNSLELIAIYFACLIFGIRTVPIDPQRGKKEIEEILGLINLKAIVTDSLIDNKEIINISLDSLRQSIRSRNKIHKRDLDRFKNVNYDDVYIISLTTGSTGTPKGVRHTFNNLVRSALAFRRKFGFSRKNVFYHNFPMTYMAGILNLFILPFISESTIILGERFNISNFMHFWKVPIQYSVNTFWLNPTMVSLLVKLDRGQEGIEYAKKTEITACVGTAPLDPLIKSQFEQKYSTPLYESYGLTETLFVSTNHPFCSNNLGSVGELLDDISITIETDNEIVINVPWMFQGYTDTEHKTSIEEGFPSGDIGYVDSNEMLYITGRKKDLIIKGGMNISPQKVERYINSLALIDECAIVGKKDNILGEKIVCYFSPHDGPLQEGWQKAVNKQISQNLGKDYCVDEFIRLESIPRNINGKIDKKLLWDQV
jgi:long-chain acyl-CoA synthetase